MPEGSVVHYVEGKARRRAYKLKRKGKLRGDVDSYVYGTLNKAGLKHGNKTTAKGARKASMAGYARRRRRSY